MKNTLLIGVAAIALIAGTGLAAAQGNKGHAPAASENGNAGAAKMDQGGGGRMDQGAAPSAQDSNASPESEVNRNADEDKTNGARRNKTNNAQAPSKTNNAQNGAAPARAGKEPDERGQNSAEQKGGERGNADAAGHEEGRRGASAALSSDQRTRIHKIVISEHDAPRVAHVDFDVRIGTVIPRGRVHYVPVPATIVEIEPEWRGYDYFIVGDQIVIVEPDTLRIVAVIPA